MATKEKKPAAERFALPEGRLINESLFEKDQYNDKSVPAYKVELAFDPAQVLGEGTVEDKIADAFDAAYPGKGYGQMFLDGKLKGPFIDGNVLAAKREAKGKPGDAYKGKIVIRANTIYNKNGQDADGGIQVFAPDVSEITVVAGRDQIYNGCMGVAGVTISIYEDEDTALPGAKFYLCAFQKTNEGERLVSAADNSALFKPVGRPAAAAGEAPARRQRKG